MSSSFHEKPFRLSITKRFVCKRNLIRIAFGLFLLIGFTSIFAQSPHGKSYKVNCAACHNSAGWKINIDSIKFNHDTLKFTLTGRHQKVDCKTCHSSLIFNEAPSQCNACHKDVHSMSVGNDCARCHTPKNWLVDYIPELHEQNGFPLIINHSNLSCVDCHVSETNLTFKRIGNECVNCHMDEYMSAKSPDHKTGGYSTNCVECHDLFTQGWKSFSTNHDFFPLVSGHNIQDCKKCHLTQNYSDASPVCASCHLSDYNGTTNPNHTNDNFSTDCKLCHTTNGWTPATFNHSTTSLACVTCHLSNYNGTVNPNHVSGNFSTDCKLCHTTNGWTPATFNHSTTSLACVTCHLSNYNGTTNPNHTTAGYSTDCKICHTSNGWTPSTFDHDNQYFPIYSGKHLNKWNQCMECHTNATYTTYTCIGCHNDKADIDDGHSSVTGYTYGPTSCFTCHPKGKK